MLRTRKKKKQLGGTVKVAVPVGSGRPTLCFSSSATLTTRREADQTNLLTIVKPIRLGLIFMRTLCIQFFFVFAINWSIQLQF